MSINDTSNVLWFVREVTDVEEMMYAFQHNAGFRPRELPLQLKIVLQFFVHMQGLF